METIKIYTLSDSSGVRYVGQSKNPNKRFYRHIFDANQEGFKNKRCAWIKSLINNGEKPIMNIIDEVPIDEWQYWEIFWINQMKEFGFNLVNDTLGGEGSYGRKVSDETKLKMSKTKKGKIPKNINLLIKSRIRPILQYNMNGEFIKEWESITLVKNTLRIYNIESVVNKKRKTANGYIWIYKDDVLTSSDLNEIIESKVKQTPKIILQLNENGEIIKEWESVNSVKREFSSINAVLRGDRKSAGGYFWKYKE